MSKDAPEYGVGVAPHPIDGKWAVLVFFESCNTQQEAQEMAGPIAQLMHETFGGSINRTQ